MKRFFLSIFFLSCLILSGNLHAQSNDQNVVIIKTVGEDGTVSIKKKRLGKNVDVKEYVDDLQLDDAKTIDITISTTGDEKASGGENLFMFKSSGGNTIKINGDGNWQEALMDFDFDFDFDDVHGAHHQKQQVKENKALLGVYPDNHEEGVIIDGLVSGGGAEKAGLKKGDVMIAINGESIQTTKDLSREMAKYQPGDDVQVDIIRDDQPMTVASTLTEKKSTNHAYSYYNKEERDPCKVFYGVYVGSYGHGKEGVGVSGIVRGNDWPAEVAGLQTGDRILAIDGIPVTNHEELVEERDKHQPGEAFTFTYLRDGEVYDVDARFKQCPKDQEETPVEEPIEEINVLDNDLEFTDNELELEEFNAFPNPTFGNLNVRFRGEAVPTTVRVVDSAGKVVYQESINNFNGYYSKELNVSGGALGTLILSVSQEGKVSSKPVILVTRA